MGNPRKISSKIVGGFSVETDDQFPYQASLRTKLLNTHFCGCFILTERWLGTAGERIYHFLKEFFDNFEEFL